MHFRDGMTGKAKWIGYENPLGVEGILRLLAAVVAADVAPAAAAENEQQGKNVAQTPHVATSAAVEQKEQENDVVAAATAPAV